MAPSNAPDDDGPDGHAPDELLAPWILRSRFAAALSAMYAAEVPAYGTLVEECERINRAAASTTGDVDASALRRITAERHGAIRVGGPGELREVARIFALLGMVPVGFYDLRDTASSSIPVVSTAFRPIDPVDLERNAFRVFTSMLVSDDPRFFDAATREAIEAHVAARDLLAPGLREQIARAESQGGVRRADAAEFIHLAVATFELDRAPIDLAWHEHLTAISPVAADIAAAPGTHLNHLTPRVLDIDELYRSMEARGIRMIDAIQGPPAWDGPLVLLRQTSFRALDEPRSMRLADGSVETRALRVRFGEVEARGVALTPEGRARYDRIMSDVEVARSATSADATDDGAPDRATLLRAHFADAFPTTVTELALQGLANVEFHAVPGPPLPPGTPTDVASLVAAGHLEINGIVYEDFLPRSAAGIFRSNLASDGTRHDDRTGTDYDVDRLAEAIGGPIIDPFALNAQRQARSLRDAADVLGIEIGT
jgi:uncharacterized glyoxalase superfamily metalloenzyme YdcJ